MTYTEQSEWLIKNGFVETLTTQLDIILWEKKISYERKLHFNWINSGRWEVTIEQYNEVIWIMDLPDSQDFEVWQFFIDVVR
jgi:hypothetical protein